jgi:CheY-like chemotaxis protein
VDAQTTIVIVDDQEDIVELMRDFLEAEGYAVITAYDGPAALAALRQQAFVVRHTEK